MHSRDHRRTRACARLPIAAPACAFLATLLVCVQAQATVPILFSVKFILDQNGNRPLIGAINSDVEVQTQLARANQILTAMGSEFEFVLDEIVDVAGASQWFMPSIDGDTLDGIRDDARGNPVQYAWRTDAINVYVTGSSGSGIAYLPLNSGWISDRNDLFVVGQGLRTTTFLHESGHILSNKHTHDDDCTGMKDDPSWTRTEIAENNFGTGPLTAEENVRVDEILYNVMSYHVSRDRFAPCQLNRHSGQASYGVQGLSPRRVFYVDGTNGNDDEYTSFSDPLRTLDYVQSHPEWFEGDVVVLLDDTTLSTPLSTTDLRLATRKGANEVHKDNQLWVLPTAESDAFPAAARATFEQARGLERAGDRRGVRRSLVRVAESVDGPAAVAIHLELAERLEEEADCAGAREHYGRVVALTVQEELRRHAEERADSCRLPASSAVEAPMP